MFRATPIFGMSRDHNRKRQNRMLQVVDNAVFCQNVLLHFENDQLSSSF